MCKVIYRADDGKEFDNKEDCAKYSALPHVWVVIRNYASMYHGSSTHEGIYTHKEDAENFISLERNREKIGRYSYVVKREIINRNMYEVCN